MRCDGEVRTMQAAVTTADGEVLLPLYCTLTRVAAAVLGASLRQRTESVSTPPQLAEQRWVPVPPAGTPRSALRRTACACRVRWSRSKAPHAGRMDLPPLLSDPRRPPSAPTLRQRLSSPCLRKAWSVGNAGASQQEVLSGTMTNSDPSAVIGAATLEASRYRGRTRPTQDG